MSRLIANRLQKFAESLLPDSQCGFCPGRGTVDMVFSLRQVIEKLREHQANVLLSTLIYARHTILCLVLVFGLLCTLWECLLRWSP